MTWHFCERLAPEFDMGLFVVGKKGATYFYVLFLTEGLPVRGHFISAAYNGIFKGKNAEHIRLKCAIGMYASIKMFAEINRSKNQVTVTTLVL